jgi:hypothetical protein
MNVGSSHRGPGRPARTSAVVPIQIHYEAPLAGRLRRIAKRLRVSQREILHQALEDWLRRQHYPKGDPDAGGPSCREIEPLGSPAPGATSPAPAPVTSQDSPPAGTSGQNPASPAPAVDLL